MAVAVSVGFDDQLIALISFGKSVFQSATTYIDVHGYIVVHVFPCYEYHTII